MKYIDLTKKRENIVKLANLDDRSYLSIKKLYLIVFYILILIILLQEKEKNTR